MSGTSASLSDWLRFRLPHRAARWRARAHLRAALPTLRAELAAIDPEGLGRPSEWRPGHGMDRLIRRNVGWAFLLGLDGRPPMRVLDLGCGFGFFLHTCQRFGHQAVGLDLPDALADGVAARLGVERVHHFITPESPAPDLSGARFDSFTAFNVTFNGHRSAARWGIDEWQTFLTNLKGHARPGARLWMRLHPHPPGGRALSPALERWFQQRGAWVRPRAGMVSVPVAP